MRKIAILINSLKLGGAEKVVQTLVNEFCNIYDVHLIMLEKEEFFPINKKVHVTYLSSSNSKTNKIYKILSMLYSAYKLHRYIKSNDIRIVQSNLFRSNYVNILSKILFSKHKVVIVDHTLPQRLYFEGFSGKLNLFLIKLLYKYADSSVSVSKKVQNELESIVKLPNRKYVIFNPFDLKLIKEKQHDPIKDFNFKKDNSYLIAIGRINSIKRYDLLIESLNLLNDKNLHLILLGKEEDVKIEELLKISNNMDNIHFLGQKDNPYKYIHKSDVLVLTSDSESFGNVLVESMICETPIISSDCGGTKEILGNNEYGLLFPIGDANGLIKCIAVMMQNSNIRNEFIKRGKLRADDFSIKKIIEQYEKVINFE